MKIAIFHNFMDNIGGAEYVDLILARELNADIYTTNIDKKKIELMGFKTGNIYSIGKIPINAPFKQEAAYYRFRLLNIEKRFKKKYDLYIIAGDWAMSGAINNKPNIWYVYSPTREIWDLYKYVRKTATKPWQRPIYDLWVIYRRIINKSDSKKVSKLIAISKTVQNRIKKYLKRDSKIIYPPTENQKYHYKPHKDYWLSVNRLFKNKKIEIQTEAFKNLPNEKLIIVGSYEEAKHFKNYANYIKKIKPKNVEIKSWVSEKELIELYANAKGFITTSKEEDYGMNVVEAMASGKPVIAPNEGGYKETILHNKTGMLIDNLDSKKLKEAIERLSKELENKKTREKYKIACQNQAKKFDTRIFIEKFLKEIKNQIKDSL